MDSECCCRSVLPGGKILSGGPEMLKHQGGMGTDRERWEGISLQEPLSRTGRRRRKVINILKHTSQTSLLH